MTKNKIIKKAFSLIEVLIALAILGIGAFAFMELLISLDKRAVKIELDTLAGNQALEVLGGIRALKVNNWSSIPSPVGSVAYRVGDSSGTWQFGSEYSQAPSTIKSSQELQEFCNLNVDICVQVGPSYRSVPENAMFNLAVVVETLPGSTAADKRPKLITVYLGGNQEYAIDSFVKLTTVVSKY